LAHVTHKSGHSGLQVRVDPAVPPRWGVGAVFLCLLTLSSAAILVAQSPTGDSDSSLRDQSSVP
jgi:hypothetical protein